MAILYSPANPSRGAVRDRSLGNARDACVRPEQDRERPATGASAPLMASLITLKRGELVHPLKTLWGHRWLGVVYAASASISGLLYVSFDRFGPTVLVAAVPIIALFLSTLYFYFRQAEINESAQKERIGATERAAADNAKHLAELRESEDRFHSAFTHAAVGMVLVSTDGRILQVNSALACLLGRAEP